MSVIATSVDVRAPAGQEEGTRSQVLRWLKAVGEPVAEHEPLIELETDKVTVEVASPGAGVLLEILKQEQEEVAPGEVLGRIGPAQAAAAPEADRARGYEAGATSSRQVDTGGTASSAVRGTGPRDAAGVAGGAAAAGGTAAAAASGASHSGLPGGAPARPLSPAVRRLLAEHSLEAASVRGTGEGGRITVADVMREAGESSRSEAR